MTDAREKGIAYFYEQKNEDEMPVFIGTKRYAGYYCLKCNRPIGLKHNRSLVTQMRVAEKTDATLITNCPQCNEPGVPSTCFDWAVPQHTLRRLTFDSNAARAAALENAHKKSSKKKSKDGNDDDLPRDGRDRDYTAPSITEKTQMREGGHVCSVYGTKYTLQEFWQDVVDNCFVQHTDKVPKDSLC